MRETGRLARFKGYDAAPEKSAALSDDHPAVVDGRTLFPGSVVGTWESKRFLVPAENSAKIGRRIEKGPWSGFPVFTLTLEERATCPRSCHMWKACFGNAMQWARRNDVEDPDFITALKAEVVTLVREVIAPNRMKPNYEPPKGLVIRLHVLGDFHSVAYVKAWADLMAKMPELHVFGYTARSLEADLDADHDSFLIAAAIADLNHKYPDRWVIRWSSDAPGTGRAIVVDKDPGLPNVIMCPAAVKKSETCSTCALCWNPNAWDKTIAFLRHGMKTRGRPRKEPPPGSPAYVMPERTARAYLKKGIEVPAKVDAVPVVERKPDDPLMGHAHPTQRAHAHKKGGWGVPQEGSAGPFDPEAAKARVASVSDEEKARIAILYGATMKKEVL